jgi:hypothetical protein
MKDKRWVFSIVDNVKKQTVPVKAIVRTRDEEPKLDLSDKDLAKLSAILGAISDKNLDAVVKAIKAIKPEKEDDDEIDELETDKKAAKDEKFDISEFSVGSDEGEEDAKTEEGEEIINTDGQDSVMHDSRKSFGSLLRRTKDSKPESTSLDEKWQKYYDKRNKEE